MPSAVVLPRPQIPAHYRLAAALRQRRTVREMSGRKIGKQQLSNLLYAACGVNRGHGPFGGPGITAASASNSQEVELYVLLEEGTYRFDGVGPGTYRVAGVFPAGWSLRSAIVNGRDTLDAPLDVKAGQPVSDLILTLTDRPAELDRKSVV